MKEAHFHRWRGAIADLVLAVQRRIFVVIASGIATVNLSATAAEPESPTPALKLPAVEVVCAGIVFQLKVYGAVPPAALAVTDPVALPKQDTLVWPLILAERAAIGCVIVACAFVVQPFASITVTVWVPAARFVAVATWSSIVFGEQHAGSGVITSFASLAIVITPLPRTSERSARPQRQSGRSSVSVPSDILLFSTRRTRPAAAECDVCLYS